MKNWCFWTVVLEKTLQSPLDSKEIKLVSPKGNQFWIFIGRTDAEAETPVLWPPDAKNWLIGKHPDAGKDWRREEKGTTEDEMVEWHHRLDGHECEWALRVGDEQGGLACCSPWGRKESDRTGRLLELAWAVVLFLVSWGASVLFSVAAAPAYARTSVPSAPFSPPHRHVSSLVFLTAALLAGMRRHRTVVLASPWWVMLRAFSCTRWPSEYLLWNNVYQVLVHF